MAEPKNAAAYPHYFRPVAGLTHVDPYRVVELFEIVSPGIQHAVKKLLVAGRRGAKDQERDVREAIDALERFLEMRAEDAAPALVTPSGERFEQPPRHPDLGPPDPEFVGPVVSGPPEEIPIVHPSYGGEVLLDQDKPPEPGAYSPYYDG